MSDVFISYARSTAAQAARVAALLRGLGHRVWLDDELPAHRAYTDVIEERLRSAKAVVVIWSAEGAKSHWVRAEANAALQAGTLVQLSVDGVMPPMPFSQIQCADLNGWAGDTHAPGWRKVAASVGDLIGGSGGEATVAASAAPALPLKPSIAVLPFTDMSGGGAEDYFADGMVEEITNALSRFPGLFVIASGSALGYRDGARDLKAIGRELGVRYLLEGSVRKAAGRVRIAVKLVNAADGAQIWTERFDDTLEDVFALQDRVANHVAAALEPTLEAAEIRRAGSRPTADLDAYDLYLRALSLWRVWDRPSLAQALELAEAAVARDPDYAWAVIMAAFCEGALFYAGWSDDPRASRRRGLELCRRAVRLAPDDPLVLCLAAITLLNFVDDVVEAERLSERAVAINDGSALSLGMSGWINAVYGDAELAVSRFEASMRLDPRSPMRPYTLTGLGMALFALRRFDEAIAVLTEVAHVVPEYSTPQVFLAASLAHLGRLDEAREVLARISAATPIDGVMTFLREPQRRDLLRAGVELARGGA